jgi:hypothetical protein
MPAQPTPAMARPNTKTKEVGAVAQIVEPASKMATEVKKTILTEK